MTDLPEVLGGDNSILSNRDKTQHSKGRGLAGKHVQSEQMQDSVAHRTDAQPAKPESP